MQKNLNTSINYKKNNIYKKKLNNPSNIGLAPKGLTYPL